MSQKMGSGKVVKPTGAKKGKGRPAQAEGAKRKRSNTNGFQIYINRVLKNVHPELGFSKNGMAVMNSFVADLFESIATEAGKLVRYQKKHTLSSADIQGAIKLVLPGDLANHALQEAVRAYNKTKATEKSAAK